MRKPKPNKGRPKAAWSSRWAAPVRLAACFLSVTLATVFVGLAPASNAIWVANGVLLAYLLLVPKRRWPAYLAVGFAAQLAGAAIVIPKLPISALYAALNVIEVLLSAFLLRIQPIGLPQFTNPRYLLRFFAFAVLIGPLAAGSIFALASALFLHTAPETALLEWVVADGLGAAVVTPACVAVFRMRIGEARIPLRFALLLLVVVATSLAAFSQDAAPLTFIVYPLLILVLLRMGLGWAALATLLVASIGSWFTLRGLGPFARATALSPLEPGIVLEVFLASAIAMIYSVSVVLEGRRVTERRLQATVALHNLVMENSRDAIVVTDLDGVRRYFSPALQRLTGLSTERIRTTPFPDLAHPEDRPLLLRALRELRSGSDGSVIEYRISKRNGEPIWVEGSLRAIRDPHTGIVSGVLNFSRDITERKLAEQNLQAAYRTVETLAITDALTGLANRRRFDQCLAIEWRRALRDRNPLSMLLIDADLFKSYNDCYGHLRGDSCLRQIAESAQDVVTRPGDLVARFGGEEFAVILPNTHAEGACQIGSEICSALRDRKLTHAGNPFGIMTVSVGCATMVPGFGQHASNLIDFADQALYRAKRTGRNRVCCGGACECSIAPAENLQPELSTPVE